MYVWQVDLVNNILKALQAFIIDEVCDAIKIASFLVFLY